MRFQLYSNIETPGRIWSLATAVWFNDESYIALHWRLDAMGSNFPFFEVHVQYHVIFANNPPIVEIESFRKSILAFSFYQSSWPDH
ncbi:hypothetical protein Agabi119p4_2037 [Agaricus bisporus var. burnettii]|uniref:Uncharacterized protein n=1 Tax=Agaricus bisporus var. burnettii TaxID=192524 RepID=A0A8H7F898_AGABI|nr:hypothetical protein Agabi119p4_2037 [Agaricus bisporus var. burnettii]